MKNQIGVRVLLVVEVGHCKADARQAESLDGLDCHCRALGQNGKLLGGGVAKHIVNLRSARKVVAHAEAEPRKIGRLEQCCYVFESVVSAVGSLGLHAYGAER